MSYVVKDSGGTQRVLPTPGLHKAVCIDVCDAGFEETPWGPKEKLLIWWELDEKHPDFEGPFRINCKYTRSLSERANLSKALESWRGQGLTQQERKDGMDLEKLIGVGCHINVVHHESNSGTMWANVAAIMPLARNEWPKPSGHYTRKTEQEPVQQRTDQQEAEAKRRYSPQQPTPPMEAYESEQQSVGHHATANQQAAYVDDSSLPF